MEVTVFIPCYINELFPEIGIATVQTLRKAGVKVEFNPNQTCCGQPAFNAGFTNEAIAVSQKFVSDFKSAKTIVCPSGSCTGFVKNYLPNLLADSKDLSGNLPEIFELTDFLVNKIGVTDFESNFKGVVTYHDGCGSLNECGIKSAPRTLLQGVKGLTLIEMEDAERCCGFGGTFSVKFDSISTAMIKSKIDSALLAKADYIVSADMSCLMHIDSYVRKNNLPLKVKHISEILA